MPVNTDPAARKRKHRREALLGAAFGCLMLLVCALVFAALCRIPNLPRWAVVLFAVCAVFSVLPMGFVLVVLRQRLNELEGGEYDAAAEY